MIQRDAHPICVNDGEVTIDAAVLAPKLGLSVGALQTEMRRGAVLGVVERGQDEDAGRIRLTFRHGSCTWGVVVEPDGRLVDTPVSGWTKGRDPLRPCTEGRMGLNAPASNATDLTERLRAQLRRVAQRGVPITYQELAQSLGLEPPNKIHQLTSLLEALMEEDATAERPFIAALVVSKARRGLPALGFFDCARRLGRCDGDDGDVDAWAYHAQEFAAAVAYWRDAEPGTRDRPHDY